jgi:PHD/YefM family antitoxin component YafN of YafNO toxin-antitoxin module
MSTVMRIVSDQEAQNLMGDLCNKVAHDRLRVVITSEHGMPELALVPIQHSYLLAQYSEKFGLTIRVDDARSVETKESFEHLCLAVTGSRQLVIIYLKGNPAMAFVPIEGEYDLEQLFAAIDIDDVLDIQEEDHSIETGCIGSVEFNLAVERVGERPYGEIAKNLQALSHDTIRRLVAKGAPSPEEFVRKMSDKRKQ